MKRTATLLALALGLSAFSALAMSQGDQAADQVAGARTRRDADSDKPKDRKADKARPPRMQRQDQAGPHQMQRAPGNRGGPQQRFARGPQGAGPQQRFAPGRQGFGPQGRGQAWDRPQFAPRDGAGMPEVCPRCGRPLDRNVSPNGMRGRGLGQGLGPRRDFGPMQRGFGNAPQGRGPAFGPPPWAGRGGNNQNMRPGPRGQNQDAPPMQGHGFGPRQRGFQGPPDAPVPDRDDVRP